MFMYKQHFIICRIPLYKLWFYVHLEWRILFSELPNYNRRIYQNYCIIIVFVLTKEARTVERFSTYLELGTLEVLLGYLVYDNK